MERKISRYRYVLIDLILVALTCRLIQVLILIYGIAYLMIHKKGYQETNTSIISSITLKVKVKAQIPGKHFQEKNIRSLIIPGYWI